MCFFVSLVPATFWVVIGYFVLFSSARADGTIKKFGQGLSVWIFVIAALIPMMGLYMTLSGLCPLEEMMGSFHG